MITPSRQMLFREPNVHSGGGFPATIPLSLKHLFGAVDVRGPSSTPVDVPTIPMGLDTVFEHTSSTPPLRPNFSNPIQKQVNTAAWKVIAGIPFDFKNLSPRFQFYLKTFSAGKEGDVNLQHVIDAHQNQSLLLRKILAKHNIYPLHSGFDDAMLKIQKIVLEDHKPAEGRMLLNYVFDAHMLALDPRKDKLTLPSLFPDYKYRTFLYTLQVVETQKGMSRVFTATKLSPITQLNQGAHEMESLCNKIVKTSGSQQSVYISQFYTMFEKWNMLYLTHNGSNIGACEKRIQKLERVVALAAGYGKKSIEENKGETQTHASKKQEGASDKTLWGSMYSSLRKFLHIQDIKNHV